MENKYYFSREITSVVHDYFVNSQDSSGRGLLSLTCDDMALVRFSTEGRSLKEMAGILGVSEACVSKRRGRILDKLQINSIAELIELAMREGIVRNTVSSITQSY